MLKFELATFEQIQQLVFPLIKTFTDFDPQEWVGEQSELFIEVGDAFADLSTLFLLVGSALSDGLLTEEELKDIIASAKTMGDAIDKIVAFFDDDEELIVNPEVVEVT